MEIISNHSETKNELIKKKEQFLFENKIMSFGKLKEFPNTHIQYIKDDVYGVFPDKNRISLYYHENGDLWFNLGGLSETPFFNDLIKKTGYIEKKDELGVYNLYKIDSNGKVADLPVDKYSIEFFQVWKDVDFFTSYKVNAQVQSKRLDLKQFLKMLPMYIESESFRIKNLMEFYNRGQIQKIDVIEQLPALQKLLEKQCDPNGDLIGNFEKINDSITEDEIKSYYDNREIFKSKGLIDERLYTICISGLRKRANDKKVKKETKEEIKK